MTKFLSNGKKGIKTDLLSTKIRSIFSVFLHFTSTCYFNSYAERRSIVPDKRKMTPFTVKEVANADGALP